MMRYRLSCMRVALYDLKEQKLVLPRCVKGPKVMH